MRPGDRMHTTCRRRNKITASLAAQPGAGRRLLLTFLSRRGIVLVHISSP